MVEVFETWGSYDEVDQGNPYMEENPMEAFKKEQDIHRYRGNCWNEEVITYDNPNYLP